jgi:glycosyltransferase involved in cell wall biosynthesis
MKILIVTDSFHTGGKERRLIELVKGLMIKGIECELVALSDVVQYDDLHRLNINIHFLKRAYKKDLSIFNKLKDIIVKAKPDIIQSWSTMASIYVAPLAKVYNIPFINAIIADAPNNKNLLDKIYLRKKLSFLFSDAIVGNSYAGLKSYNAPCKKSYAIHNGFDMKRIQSLTEENLIRQQFNISTPLVVGMVGKFEDRKDYYTYIEAAIRLVRQRGDVSFLAVGDGKNFDKAKAMVSDNHDRIIFTGRQSGVESIINTFTLGVLTTNDKVHGEGSSNAILEYMVLGKTVVATKGGGTSEIVLNNETGFIINPFDIDALVEKINLLLDHKALRERMGELSFKRIQENFSLEKMTNGYINIYQKLLNKKAVSKV